MLEQNPIPLYVNTIPLNAVFVTMLQENEGFYRGFSNIRTSSKSAEYPKYATSVEKIG